MRSPNVEALTDSNLWHRNLYGGLAALGHEIIEFDYDMGPLLLHADTREASNRRFVETERPKLEAELLRQVRAAHRARGVNLFFSYFYDACASPGVISEIGSLGVPTVNFYCNAVHQFDLVKEIAPAFDACMVPERAALPKYRAIGARPVHIQMAADPRTYRPFDVPREYDVTFVGQKYGDRPAIVYRLLCAGIQARVWGPGWSARAHSGEDRQAMTPAARARRAAERMRHAPLRTIQRALARVRDRRREQRLASIAGPPLSDEEVVRMYSRSRISLGFSTVSDPVPSGQPKAHMRLRDFEATMSGACYATGYVDEIPQYFEPDKEIVTYSTAAELLDKVRFLLAHPQQIESIRMAARRRALNEHTWAHRFVQLFDSLGLPARVTQAQS